MNGVSGFSLVTAEDEFVALDNEWRELWGRVPTAAFFQTFDYCFYSWKHVVRPAKGKLRCIVGRENGRLVLIWPLVKSARKLFSIVRPLDSFAPHCTDILVEEDDGTLERVRSAYRFLLDACRPDIISFHYVYRSSRLHAAVSDFSVSTAAPEFVPVIDWKGHGEWGDYYKSLSKSYRKVQDRKRKQLSASGEVTFETVDDKMQIRELIHWILAEKRKWSERAGKQGPWLRSERYENFLIALSTDAQSRHPIIMYVLKSDGRVLAAQLASVCAHHVDWMIAAFDAEFARASPGILLNEHCLQWAFCRELNCDLGPGSEENKLFWSGGNGRETEGILVANTRRSKSALAALRMQRRIFAHLRQRAAQ